jgi:hypothetical protein
MISPIHFEICFTDQSAVKPAVSTFSGTPLPGGCSLSLLGWSRPSVGRSAGQSD